VDGGSIVDAPTLIANRNGPAAGIAQVQEIGRVAVVAVIAVLADADEHIGNPGIKPRLRLEHPDHAANRPA